MKKLFLTAAFGFGVISIWAASPKQNDFVPRKIERRPPPNVINYTNPPTQSALLETAVFTNNISPEWLKPSTRPFTLGPGDRLEIELLDQESLKDPSSRQIVSVGPDGKIYYSMLPGVDVWGLTLTEARNLLEREYGKFTRNPPQIGVTLRAIESKKVWLLGRFQVPGAYPMASPVTLLEALSLAGGTQSLTAAAGQQEITPAMNAEELADLRRAFVIRSGKLVPVDFERLVKKGDFSQNIYLQPDDFVYVPPATARQVYVIGAVSQPRVVPYQQGMTLVSAISSAGGTFKESRWSEVAVVRGSVAQPQITTVDYKAIARGFAPDVPLEPDDIIYVPLKPYRHLMRYADLILNTFVTTVAINEGARAVSAATPPTGIVIPLGSTITISQPTPISVR